MAAAHHQGADAGLVHVGAHQGVSGVRAPSLREITISVAIDGDLGGSSLCETYHPAHQLYDHHRGSMPCSCTASNSGL
ncbi:Uncharacterised protein [Mycobacterium tuberculosis]|uniref:Uncharacterized protein n=1 Tax=Mycobacterium tuberculosis TaxID=1773 RepID=A0A654U889_MYCTX|nr:Uncharacterised protein [Mycobacterium tuberculosis]CKP85110.1 Uncharacterised protein [Mycobacterium tuberculosis]CKQ86208.1 Uncharacterised protein [Mycobacterium tuberculosis]CKR36185.1 Uncharacterised protein [Mycobacterium tuberculosis]CKR48055.1 Uncharacterised protein [Mycobacterium tuberculosis]